jgi:hypothetical protein
LIIPDGIGGTTVKSCNPDQGGYFDFDSIPIGNHDIEIIYQPMNDTITRFITITPNSEIYGGYYLASDIW